MGLLTLPKLSRQGQNESWADVEDNDKALRDIINGTSGSLDAINVAGIIGKGTTAARPAASTANAAYGYWNTDTETLQRSTGSAWEDAMFSTPSESALPASPVDGQEIAYVADATNGVVWHFKYRSASASAYKWEFIGGGSLWAAVETAETRAASTYGALATAGPSITVPLAGDYRVEIGCRLLVSAALAGFMSYDVGGTGASDQDAASNTLSAVNYEGTVFSRNLKTGLAASTALVSKYRCGTATTLTFSYRRLSVVPVRVG